MGICQDIYPDCDLNRWSCIPTTALANPDDYYTKPEVDELLDSFDVAVISGDVITLSGDVQTINENITVVSGDIQTISGDVITISGDVVTISGDVITNTNNIATISGDVATVSGDVITISGDVITISGDVQTISGDVATVSGDVTTISGDVITISGDVIALSGEVQSNYSELTAHTSNNDIHVTTADKENWNGKIDASAVTNNYYTSAQTNAAIEQAVSGKADTSTVATLSGQVTANTESISNKANYSDLTAHTSNNDIHVTTQDKSYWDGKLDATAYTPTDLSQYWTSAQTDSAITAAVSGKASTSSVETLSGEVQTLSGSVANKADTSALTAHTSDSTIHVTSADKQNWNGKLDATAYTPTDLSQYWTSAQTNSAITQATSGKADTSTVETLSGQVTANTASISNKADTSALTAHTSDTTIHVTSADKTNWDGKATTASVQAVDNKFGGMVIVKLTQSQYAALTTKDPNTLYVVVSD